MTRLIKDSDILKAMEMFLNYDSEVYGYDQSYYLSTLSEQSSARKDDKRYDEHELDDSQGKTWLEESLDKEGLSDEQIKYLTNAYWMYHV